MFDPIRDSAASAESGIMPSPHSETQAPHKKSWAHAEGGAASADIPYVFAVPLSPMECAVHERDRSPHDSRQLGRLHVFEGLGSSYVPTRGPEAEISHGSPLPASLVTSEMDVDVQHSRSTEDTRQGEQPDALRSRSDPDAADLADARVYGQVITSDSFTNRSQPWPATLIGAAGQVPSRHGLPDVENSDHGDRYQTIRPALRPWQVGVQADQLAASRGTVDEYGPANAAGTRYHPRLHRTIMPDCEGQRKIDSLQLVATHNTLPSVDGFEVYRLAAHMPGPMALNTELLDQTPGMDAHGAVLSANTVLQGQQIPSGASSFPAWTAAQSRFHSAVRTVRDSENTSSFEDTLLQHGRDPWRTSKYGTKPGSSEDDRVFTSRLPRDDIIKGMKREVLLVRCARRRKCQPGSAYRNHMQPSR